MSSISNVFPEQAIVWQGAILASIAHAVAVGRFPSVSHEQSWDGDNYNIQDSAGSRGTVTFEGKRLVAVFFYEPSPRNPFASKNPYDLDQFFVGLPAELAALAHNEALQYLLQELDGRAVPVATTAFWGDGKSRHVSTAEPWEDVWKHGAVLLKKQLQSHANALKAWQADYELSPLALELVERLYEIKLKNPTETIELDAAAVAVIKANASGSEGVAASRESFMEIGFMLP